MIQFKDFTPEVYRRNMLQVPTQYEALEDVVQRVNEWVQQKDVDVVNVETVALPSLYYSDLAYTMSVRRLMNRQAGWTQTVRVWYRLN